MSDLETAAAAMNVPEAMVQRSAEARAKATGASVEEILSAWAGGAPAPAATTSSADAPETTLPDPIEAPTPAPTADEPSAVPSALPIAVATMPSPSLLTTSVGGNPMGPPPLLVSKTDRPFLSMLGAMAALALALMAGLIAPTVPEPGNDVFSSAVPLSADGLAGRDNYRSLGCGACHTQMVRPLAADAGLGAVTLADTNQELGIRRLGPDLSNIATRLAGAADYESVLSGANGHPAYLGIADADVNNLVAYLSATNAQPISEDTGS